MPDRRQWWEAESAQGPQSQAAPRTAAEQTSSSSATAMTAPIVASGSRGSQPAAWTSGESHAFRSTRIEAWMRSGPR